MGRFDIRPATPSDAVAVTKLLRESYPVLMRPAYATDVLTAALPTMTRANAGLLSSGTYFLAETRRGDVIGCGGWTRQVPGTDIVEGDTGHIRHFATHPDWVGHGIGRALYVACETQAAVAGIKGFDCFASLNAEGFYSAIGFVPIDRIEVAIAGVKFPAVLMRRVFRNSPW